MFRLWTCVKDCETCRSVSAPKDYRRQVSGCKKEKKNLMVLGFHLSGRRSRVEMGGCVCLCFFTATSDFWPGPHFGNHSNDSSPIKTEPQHLPQMNSWWKTIESWHLELWVKFTDTKRGNVHGRTEPESWQKPSLTAIKTTSREGGIIYSVW